MKNTEARKTAKTVLGFLLVVGLLIGALFGIKVPYEVKDIIPEDTTNVKIEQPQVETPSSDNGNVEVPVEDETNTDDGVTEDVPQDSTPTEDTEENVDNSADTEVAEPTEDETTATEGDVENA